MGKDDWKKRCHREYLELCGRIEKLRHFICFAGVKPNCPLWMLKKQLDAMEEYKEILEARNYIEHMWDD